MSNSSAAKQDIPQNPAFTFQPPPGGDVSLKSCDGVIFLAHSMLLGMASKVFSDMFTSPTVADAVELAEDAEAISIMLAFIYPVMRPPIDTIPLFEKAVRVAHKYDIDVLFKTLDQTGIQQPGLVRRHPLRVFILAAEYGLRETQAHAAKLVWLQDRSTLSPEGLVQLAKEFPNSAHIIGLVGVQLIRPGILGALLNQGNMAYQTWPVRGSGYYISCSSCLQKYTTTNEGRIYYRPGWLIAWASSLHSALMSSPLSECDKYFQGSYIWELKRIGGCCSACIEMSFSQRAEFDKWAADTRLLLETELAKLDVLYTL
jgi:hypothetical protein